jgi:exopolysaccharide biosynthesis WecB/TagA/CpsF family protein
MMADAAGRQEFLGLDFDRIDAGTAARRIAALASEPRFSYVVTPNVDHVVQLDRAGDPALARAYRDAALCLCDSRILARLAHASGIDLPVVTGSDLTHDLLRAALPPMRVAVVGGDARMHGDLARLFPRFEWTFFEPPMKLRHDAAARTAVVTFTETAGADVIFLAVGAPQSEMICAETLQQGRARGVALCIGASLEFLTGAKDRAPRWVQRAGFEWLFRLLREPQRLWRRYLVDGPRIFLIWRKWRRAQAVKSARHRG